MTENKMKEFSDKSVEVEEVGLEIEVFSLFFDWEDVNEWILEHPASLGESFYKFWWQNDEKMWCEWWRERDVRRQGKCDEVLREIWFTYENLLYRMSGQ